MYCVIQFTTCYSFGVYSHLVQDSRFNQAVDKKTGYRTRSILCMPIKNHLGEVCWTIHSSTSDIRDYATVFDKIHVHITSRPVHWGGGGFERPPFLTERSTIVNNKPQKILLQTLDFDFKTKFGKKKTGRENGLLLNPIH